MDIENAFNLHVISTRCGWPTSSSFSLLPFTIELADSLIISYILGELLGLEEWLCTNWAPRPSRPRLIRKGPTTLPYVDETVAYQILWFILL